MKILRNQEIICSYKKVQVGDQIIINLTGLGEHTATAQKITDNGIMFLFDNCIAEKPMNDKWTNKGGYEKSELCEWVNTELLNAFPDEIKSSIVNLTIPTYGQMFGHDDFYNNFEPDEDEQLPLMAKRKNRVADFKDDYEWYWLRNSTKTELSAADFAFVGNNGKAGYDGASGSGGVRPVFWLV